MEVCEIKLESDSKIDVTNVVEVAFKAGRIGIFANLAKIDIKQENYIIVEADKGQDLGKALQIGQVTAGFQIDENIKNVVRLATEEDLKKLTENRELEDKALRVCKDKIQKHGLNMNLVDTEYQWDHNKLTFYFTSDERVDFRKLVRDLASKFRTRIELRQIGVRDAARHVGGYGACGCQLCCTMFLKKFENITTQYMKDQLIPMNPSRLTGICGRLKCCLAFEKDYYLEELDKYPPLEEWVETPNGRGIVEKIDIFNGVIYVRLESNDIEKFSVNELQPLLIED
jgi:cell fate regulator YaaT (PSP1 superfamily)